MKNLGYRAESRQLAFAVGIAIVCPYVMPSWYLKIIVIQWTNFKGNYTEIPMTNIMAQASPVPIRHLFDLSSKVFSALGLAVLPLSTSLTDIFLLLAIFCSLFAGQGPMYWKILRSNPVALAFVGLFGLYVFGASYSIAPSHEISKALLKNLKLLYGFALLPLFTDAKWRDYAVNALMTVITLMMFLSFAKFFGWIQLTTRYHDAAVFKSHIQTNFLMAFYAYLLAGRMLDRSDYRLLWVVLFTLASLKTLFFSEGRSGYIVFGVLMTLFGWQRFQLKGAALMFLGTAALATSAFFLSSGFQDRFTQVISETQRYHAGDAGTSTGLRLSFYKNAYHMIKEKPLLGSGTGSVPSRYRQVETKPIYQTHNPHNEYLNIGIQLGLLGVGYLLFFFGFLFKQSGMLSTRWQHLAQATILSIAIGSLLNSWLLDTMQGHFFAIMIALCFATILPTAENLKSH